MEILIVIILGIIAYYIYRIYRQREDEKIDIHNEKMDALHEEERRERFKDYPYLYGNLEGNWLDVFVHQAESGTPMLKMAFFIMLGESTKMEWSEGSMAWDNLWNLSLELLEDLEKHHEGTLLEHEIAIVVYWQIAAEAVGELIKINPEISIDDIRKQPYTDIKKILKLFPKKLNHPVDELSFVDNEGKFPRESDGSEHMKSRIKEQGF